MITATLASITIGLIIGYIICSAIKEDNFFEAFHIKEKLDSLNNKIDMLNVSNELVNSRIAFYERKLREKELLSCNCYHCNKIFWGKDEKEQKIADKLKSIISNTDEITKILNDK